MTQATRKQTELKSPVVYRCKDKTTGRTLGYLVPSNTTAGVNYEVKFVDHKLTCNCKAGQNGMRCCHLRAIEEVMQARREMQAQQEQPVTPAATLAGYDVIGEALRIVNECRNVEAAGDAYEMIAEMRHAVAEVPSFVERFRDERPGCKFCGGRHQSWNCVL